MTEKRKPVPAGGEPIPSAIAAMDAETPQASADKVDQTAGGEPGDGDRDGDEQGEAVEVVVLVAFDGHQPGDVIGVRPGVDEAMQLAGRVDPNPAAVAAAKR